MSKIDARLSVSGIPPMNDTLGQIEYFFGDDTEVQEIIAKLAGPDNEDPRLLVRRLTALRCALIKHAQDCFVDAETALEYLRNYGAESLEQWLSRALVAKKCCDWCDHTIYAVRQLARVRN